MFQNSIVIPNSGKRVAEISAVIFPPRDKLRLAMIEASRAKHDPACRLYTDGFRLAWLPRPLPGWFRIGSIEVRDAYEQTDATAGCCDIGAAK